MTSNGPPVGAPKPRVPAAPRPTALRGPPVPGEGPVSPRGRGRGRGLATSTGIATEDLDDDAKGRLGMSGDHSSQESRTPEASESSSPKPSPRDRPLTPPTTEAPRSPRGERSQLPPLRTSDRSKQQAAAQAQQPPPQGELRISPRAQEGSRTSDRVVPEPLTKQQSFSGSNSAGTIGRVRPRRGSGWTEDDEAPPAIRAPLPPQTRQRAEVVLESMPTAAVATGTAPRIATPPPTATGAIITRGRSAASVEADAPVSVSPSSAALAPSSAPTSWAGVRQRSFGHGGDVLGVDPEEYKPLVGLKNKTRRNSLAGISGFSGDPALRMAQLVGEYPFFMEQLARLIDSSDGQRLVDAIINVTVPFGQTLNVAKALILAEFEHNKSQPSSILRGNCVAAKLMGSFGHFIGQKYLHSILHAHVNMICEQRERLRFEVDPSKETRADVRAANRKNLIEFTQSLMTKIMDPKNVIPPEICAMAKFTADAAKEVCPDHYSQLVGGYIMLRLINPSLVAPEAYKVISATQVPSPHARRNLTLVSKLLQNISNGLIGSSKESFMTEFSDFVAEQSQLFFKFLERVAGAGEDLTTRKPIPADEADVGFLEGKHLAFLLKVLSMHGDTLSKALTALPRKTVRELELLQRVREVEADQEPPKNKNPTVLPWLSKHYRSGVMLKVGDKKRKKKKKPMRLELTRFFLYVVDPTLSISGVTSSAQIRKVYPLDALEVSLKQEKKESFLEISTPYKTMTFTNHEDCDKVEDWHRAITAVKSEPSRSKPQSGNERFFEKSSRGAVSDVLTAMQGMPRLPYQVQVQQRFAGARGARGPAEVKAVVRVMSFGCQWDVELSFFQISAVVGSLQGLGGEGLIVSPLPHIFAHLFTSRPGTETVDPALVLGIDDSGRPSLGCVVMRDWLAAFLAELQSSFDYSHCKVVLDVLELSSPFRAAASLSIAHLRWIHRYKLGLVIKDRRGANVLMHLVSAKEERPESTEMMKFLIDSRAIALKDVDNDGNSVMHRCLEARVLERAVMLCELGVDHIRNKAGLLPLHIAIEFGDDWLEFVEACADQAHATGDANIVLGVDEAGRTPLHVALMARRGEMAECIVDAVEALESVPRPVAQFAELPKKPGTSCYHLAVAAGLGELANRLVTSGLVTAPSDAAYFALASGMHEMLGSLPPFDWKYVEPEAKRTLMHAACASGKPECISLCLDHKLEVTQTDIKGVSPVMCACQSGNMAAVASVLRYASNVADAVNVPDASGMTALHYAAMSHSLPVIKLLLQSGAVYSRALDKEKRSPLYIAVETATADSVEDAVAVVRHFLSLGFSPNVIPNSGTPLLHVAVAKQHSALVAALLEAPHMEVNALDRNSSSALLLAVQSGSVKLVEMLVARGADPLLANAQGEHPINVALKLKRQDIAALFKD